MKNEIIYGEAVALNLEMPADGADGGHKQVLVGPEVRRNGESR